MSPPARTGVDAVPPERGAGNGLAPLAIVVMGVSGAGKSTLGSRLAAELGGAFVEGDLLHDDAAVASMRAGRPLTDADRWPWLDRVASAMRDAVAANGIAVAACSALRQAYRARLAAASEVPVRFIYLRASREDLRRRLEGRSGHYMPARLLTSQLATLEEPRIGEKALTLDAGAPIDELCRDAIIWLERKE